MAWCFRIRVILCRTARLSLAEHEWLVPNPSGGEEVELVAVGENETLDKAQTVVLRGVPRQLFWTHSSRDRLGEIGWGRRGEPTSA
jgi:hypothetical protein